MKVEIKQGAIHLTVQNGDVVEGADGVRVHYAGKGIVIVKTLAKSDLKFLEEDS